MERFTLIRTGQGNYLATRDDGDLVGYADAQGVINAANKRATEAERRLALAVAEVRAWRAWAEHPDTYLNDCASQDYVCIARSATNADPELTKMIGGGE